MGGADPHAPQERAMNGRDDTLTRVLGVLHRENAKMRASIEGVARLSVEPRTPRKVQSVRPIGSARQAPPLSVLVAEDDDATGRVYADALRAMRVEPWLCPTMAEARERIAAMIFDVAVIDLLMREGPIGGIANGADLIPLVRARSPRTRIVVSTGLEDAAAREMLLVAGVDPSSVEIVAKVRPHELRKVVGAR